MKSKIFGAALLGLLLCGCETPQETKKVEQKTPYDKPLTSLGAKFGALPPAVQTTVLAEAGGADIVDAVRETKSGRVVYRITFKDPVIYPPLLIAPDGSVLNPDMTVAVNAVQGVKIKSADVPAKVMKVVDEKGPVSGPSVINKETWGDRTVYIFSFKDEAHFPKMFIAADGTVLQEGQ